MERSTGNGILYLRLSLMMFLQFAVWGAWAVVIAKHMENLGFSGAQISYVFGTTAFGSLVSPIIAGWIADRLLPAQIFTAISHFVGAILLFIAWRQTEFWPLWTSILLYAILYMPTIALTNAIAFHHMRDAQRFGNIRVWGTIGWIFVQWFMAGYLRFWEHRMPGVSRVGDCLLIAGIVSVLMGLYCLFLPNTPPAKEAKNPYAFLEALQLRINRNFMVLLTISFVVAIELPFYYNLTYLFLTEPRHPNLHLGGVGLPESTGQFAMTLGQVGEVLLMLLLYPSIRYLGMRTTIFLGILAWPVRYAIFAIGQPAWLVVAAQTLHGICYSFFFAGGMIAVERLSPKDVRASAQGLLVFATNGLGMLIGHFLSGRVHDFFKTNIQYGTTPQGDPLFYHNWAMIFTVPIVITVLAGLAFIARFSEQRFREDAESIERGEVEKVYPNIAGSAAKA
ncbi:Putative nucleoside transporter YegT [bacterium HR16]|nr:Putative nucleoside transporter YegT [bacterium HR16]